LCACRAGGGDQCRRDENSAGAPRVHDALSHPIGAL
jgi:hypothetical protein